MSRHRRWNLFADHALPRRRRAFDPYCHVRYDDDFDDLDIGAPRCPDEHPTSAGMIGFIFSVVSLGLLAVLAVLWVLWDQDVQQRPNEEAGRWLRFWSLFMDLLSFCAALVAVICGGRGLTPSNPLYRRWAITGFILGIIEVIVTVILGFILTCFVLIFEAMRGPGG